jgi:hypothetical protein
MPFLDQQPALNPFLFLRNQACKKRIKILFYWNDKFCEKNRAGWEIQRNEIYIKVTTYTQITILK